MDALTQDRLIVGAGTSESAWRGWSGLANVTIRPLESWLRADQRLVVVAPHPDDEILCAGGLIGMHAARGGAIRVVAVTDGEASHPGSSHWQPKALAAQRRAESRDGLALLVATAAPSVLRLGFPDGAVQAHTGRLEAALLDALRPDDLVVTTWRSDGHPDHDATGAAAASACSVLGCALIEAPVWAWHWADPADARLPWNRLHGLRLSPEAAQRKRLALKAHTTQLTPRDTGDGPVLGKAIVERAARAIEYFFC